MIKVRKLSSSSTTPDGYMIRCPACDDFHVLRGWTFNGDLEKPTFSPSLLVTYYDEDGITISSRCHSYIVDGTIKYLDDCSHKMRGTTIELPAPTFESVETQ